MVSLWEGLTGELLTTLELARNTGEIWSVEFSPDGKTLATGDNYGKIMINDADTGQLLITFDTHEPIQSLTYAPDGKTLVCVSQNGTIRFYDLNANFLKKKIDDFTLQIYSIAYTPDGSSIVTGNMARISFWNSNTGKLEKTIDGLKKNVNTLAFSNDGKILASLDSDNPQYPQFWDVESGKLIGYFTQFRDFADRIALSPDISKIAIGGRTKTIRLWEITTEEEKLKSNHLKSLPYQSDNVRYLTFSPGSNNLLSACDYNTIRVWDVETDKLIHTFTVQSRRIHKLVFSKDGNMLASASENGTVSVWDLKTGALINTFSDQNRNSTDLDFALNGKIIAFANGDAIYLCDILSGVYHDPLRGHTMSVNCLVNSPDGNTIVSGSMDGTVLLWDLTKLANE